MLKKINEKLVKCNFSSRKGAHIKYIVIHDTENISKGADANAHFTLHNRENRGVSVHYFVDDKQILRIIKDEDKSWHCGYGKGRYGITNENSIGVEMCINADDDINKTGVHVKYIKDITIVSFIMNESISIIENSRLAGLNIPEVFTRFIDFIDTKFNNKNKK